MAIVWRDLQDGDLVPSDGYDCYGEAQYGLTVIDTGMDDRVLDYHDCLLRVRDVALLTGLEHWLNDTLMSWYFTYLQREKFARFKHDVAFVDGSVGFLVANMPSSEVGAVLKPLKLDDASVIFFQVRGWGGGGEKKHVFPLFSDNVLRKPMKWLATTRRSTPPQRYLIREYLRPPLPPSTPYVTGEQQPGRGGRGGRLALEPAGVSPREEKKHEPQPKASEHGRGPTAAERRG
jgi:hypothetical protein